MDGKPAPPTASNPNISSAAATSPAQQPARPSGPQAASTPAAGRNSRPVSAPSTETLQQPPPAPTTAEVNDVTRKIRKTLNAYKLRAIYQIKVHASLEFRVAAVFNVLVSFIFFMMSLVSICILFGLYLHPLPSFYYLYVAQYAVHDRPIYYPRGYLGSRDSEQLYTVLCDVTGYLLYLTGSILFLLSVTIIHSDCVRISFGIVYIVCAVLCALLVLCPKFVMWSLYEHFVHDDEYLVVCRGYPLLLWVPGKKNGVITSAQSVSAWIAKSITTRLTQLCENFSKAIRQKFGDFSCECVQASKNAVLRDVTLMYFFLSLVWILSIVVVLFFYRKIKRKGKRSVVSKLSTDRTPVEPFQHSHPPRQHPDHLHFADKPQVKPI